MSENVSGIQIIFEILDTLSKEEKISLIKRLASHGVSICSIEGHKFIKAKEIPSMFGGKTVIMICQRCGKKETV